MAGGPARLLLVDDNDHLRRLVRVVAEGRSDVEVCAEAIDAHEAVRLCAQFQPDGVVLDQEMPGRTGVEALPDVIAAAPRTVVVVFSSATDPAIEQLALDGGAAGYFRKGVDDVEDVLDALLAARDRTAARARSHKTSPAV